MTDSTDYTPPAVWTWKQGNGGRFMVYNSALTEFAAMGYEYGYTLGNPDAVVAWATPRLLPLDHEEMWLLSLDGRSALGSSRRVGQGGCTAAPSPPRTWPSSPPSCSASRMR